MDHIDTLAKQALDTFRDGFKGEIPPPMSPWNDAPPALRDVLRIAVMIGQLNSIKNATP